MSNYFNIGKSYELIKEDYLIKFKNQLLCTLKQEYKDSSQIQKNTSIPLNKALKEEHFNELSNKSKEKMIINLLYSTSSKNFFNGVSFFITIPKVFNYKNDDYQTIHLIIADSTQHREMCNAIFKSNIQRIFLFKNDTELDLIINPNRVTIQKNNLYFTTAMNSMKSILGELFEKIILKKDGVNIFNSSSLDINDQQSLVVKQDLLSKFINNNEIQNLKLCFLIPIDEIYNSIFKYKHRSTLNIKSSVIQNSILIINSDPNPLRTRTQQSMKKVIANKTFYSIKFMELKNMKHKDKQIKLANTHQYCNVCSEKDLAFECNCSGCQKKIIFQRRYRKEI